MKHRYYHGKHSALFALIAAILLFAAPSGYGQEPAYPAKPIRVFVPFAPGSTTDGLTRLLTQTITANSGKTFIVENKAGGFGMIVAREVAHAAPNGSTLLMATNGTLAASPYMYKDLGFDPVKNFAMVAIIVVGQNILAVHPSVPAATVAQLVTLAKQKPAGLFYGSSSVTSLAASELFKKMAGVNITSVPYTKTGDLLAAIAGGSIQMAVLDQLNGTPMVKAGTVKALAVTGLKRSALVPDLPTLDESGFKGFAVNSWVGMAAPAGTPAEIKDWLSKEISAFLARPETTERLTAFGYDGTSSTPATASKYLVDELVRWKELSSIANITPQ